MSVIIISHILSAQPRSFARSAQGTAISPPRKEYMLPKKAGDAQENNRRFGAKTIKRLLVPILSFVLVLAAIILPGYFNVRNAREAAQESLMASAHEQSALLAATWQGQVNTLNAVAIELAEYDKIDENAACQRLKRLLRESDYDGLMYALADGNAISADGSSMDISRMEFFLRAMEGGWAVEKCYFKERGDTLIALSVPITKSGKAIGAVVGLYSEQVLARLLIPAGFGGEAYSFVCREDGSVSVGTEDTDFSENNIRELLEKNSGDASLLKRIDSDIADGRSGAFTIWISGVKLYATYVPLENRAAGGMRILLFSFVHASPIDEPAIRQSHYNALLVVFVLLAAAAIFAWVMRTEKSGSKRLREERDRLSAIEKQNRISAEKSGLIMARYDLKTKTVYGESALTSALGYGSETKDAPEKFIEDGMVAEESISELRGFFVKLSEGAASSAVVSLKCPTGFRWYSMEASLAEDSEGKPYQAILVLQDVTTEREKEALYRNWLRTIQDKDPRSFTLFRCNLSKGASFDVSEGSLLTICFSPDKHTFNERTDEYAGRFVHIDDYEKYKGLLNSENLLAAYYRGKTKQSLDYREMTGEDSWRWLHVSIETLKYSGSDDIEVIIMYEDIDSEKRAELAAKARADIDPMTGVLNRTAFIETINEELPRAGDTPYAVILIDLDGFRNINDSFGHAVGDQALYEVGHALRTVVSRGDILGRIGGDEFMIFARGVETESVAEKRVIQVQALLRKAYSLDVHLSASVGIAFFPADGRDFKELYRRADVALYTAKQSGKDAFSFYISDSSAKAQSPVSSARTQEKRRMLIFDDDESAVAEIKLLFENEYRIDVCSDEEAFIFRLHRYGMALSLIIISLDVRDEDGFGLLSRLRSSEPIGSVPIIVTSAERGQCVAALRCGARDYIPKPVNRDVLRARVESAAARTDNERLRAQNAYLQTQSGERSKYRTVFESTGTLVVEYDWLTGVFTYDPDMPRIILGRYDERSLWHIFLSDMVADAMDVKAMQEMVRSLAMDRNAQNAKKDVRLKAPDGSRRWFAVNIFKRTNELNLTNKIILTFSDINDKVLTEERLRYQAEHDALTGLYNRSAFLSAADAVVKASTSDSYILMCADIDNFRFINERFGRDEGDRLLKFAAEKLLVYSESMEGFPGRLSNDVFAVLLKNTVYVIAKANEIMQGFFADYPLKAKLSCRAGAYIISDTDITVDTMLDRAAVAKESIRGKYGKRLALYDESMNRQALLEKDIADHMEAALADNQFQIYFQPQFNHLTGALAGAEALVRWVDPRRGVISPMEFIPVFEKNGFIVKLDEYVWEKTAEHMSGWLLSGGAKIAVSVNVSREDTKDPELCSRLTRIIKKYGIPIQLFRLEITESMFADDAERLSRVVDDLHRAGFLIEMDDFGSGYSSLNILKDIPVDILKLDMRFFAGNDNLGRGGMIVGAVLRMSRWLGIPVIAEGVEHKHQADFLLSIGCPTIQGFLYEKPMPVKEFTDRFIFVKNAEDVSDARVSTLLNKQGFWDSSSFDSSLFSHFIGPAVVFEARGGEYEFIRMNTRFMELIGTCDDGELSVCDIMNFLPEDKEKVGSEIQGLIGTGEDAHFSARSQLGNGSVKKLDIVIRLIAKSEDRALIFALVNE